MQIVNILLIVQKLNPVIVLLFTPNKGLAQSMKGALLHEICLFFDSYSNYDFCCGSASSSSITLTLLHCQKQLGYRAFCCLLFFQIVH